MYTTIHFSKEKQQLLRTVSTLGLPIVIDGKIGSGKSTMGSFFKGMDGMKVCDPMESGHGYITLSDAQELVTNSEELSKLVIVDSTQETRDIIRQLKEHVKIQCFRPTEDQSNFIKIVLVKEDELVRSALKRVEKPFYIMKGFTEEEVIREYNSQENLNIIKIIKTKDQLMHVLQIAKNRAEEATFFNAKKVSDLNYPILHFAIDMQLLLTHKEEFRTFVRIARATSVYLTAYQESLHVYDGIIEEAANEIVTNTDYKDSKWAYIEEAVNSDYLKSIMKGRSQHVFNINNIETLDAAEDLLESLVKIGKNTFHFVIDAYGIREYDTPVHQFLQAAENTDIKITLTNTGKTDVHPLIMEYFPVRLN